MDWAGIPPEKKSTFGGIFSVGSVAISWYNRKQRYVVLILAEVENMVASQASCEVIWMRKILVRLFHQEMDLTVIYFDNQSCIKLYKNMVFQTGLSTSISSIMICRLCAEDNYVATVHSNLGTRC